MPPIKKAGETPPPLPRGHWDSEDPFQARRKAYWEGAFREEPRKWKVPFSEGMWGVGGGGFLFGRT